MARRSAAAVVPDSPPVPSTPPSVPSATYQHVPVSHVVESPLNPRRAIDDAALAELTASIAEHGILEPIVVREREIDFGEDSAERPMGSIVFEVVAGARRLRAAKRAGLTDVPVMVRAVTDAQLLELALAENVHRASMTPMDEARALQRVAELDGIYRDPRVLAGKIGRSETYVRDRLRLLRLVDDAQTALDAGAITATHGERIARLPIDQQSVALEHCFSPFLLDDAGTDTIRGALDAGRWEALAHALMSVADLDRYLAAHATIDVTAPEIQQALRPSLEELLRDDLPGDPSDDGEGGTRDAEQVDDAFATATVTLPQLSTDYTLRPKEAAALRVIPISRWKQLDADEGDCGYGQAGLIVHGEREDGSRRIKPELVTFCANRECSRHWPQEKRQKTSPAAPRVDWKARAEKREREQKAWNEEFEKLKPLIVRHTAGIKLTLKALVQAVPNIGYSVGHHFGVRLTDKNMPQALALYSLSRMNLQEFTRSAKAIGFDVKAARKEIAVAQNRTKPAKAAKKGGRK